MFSPNRRYLGGGGVRGVLENEQGRTRGERGSKFGNFEQTYFLNVPQKHSQQNILPDEHISPN